MLIERLDRFGMEALDMFNWGNEEVHDSEVHFFSERLRLTNSVDGRRDVTEAVQLVAILTERET